MGTKTTLSVREGSGMLTATKLTPFSLHYYGFIKLPRSQERFERDFNDGMFKS